MHVFSSLLYIETADRPGLLLEIIKVITDVNLDVESAEIDTEVCLLLISLFKNKDIPQAFFVILNYCNLQGLIAKEKFHVSYRGAALTDPLSQVRLSYLITSSFNFVFTGNNYMVSNMRELMLL